MSNNYNLKQRTVFFPFLIVLCSILCLSCSGSKVPKEHFKNYNKLLSEKESAIWKYVVKNGGRDSEIDIDVETQKELGLNFQVDKIRSKGENQYLLVLGDSHWGSRVFDVGFVLKDGDSVKYFNNPKEWSFQDKRSYGTGTFGKEFNKYTPIFILSTKEAIGGGEVTINYRLNINNYLNDLREYKESKCEMADSSSYNFRCDNEDDVQFYYHPRKKAYSYLKLRSSKFIYKIERTKGGWTHNPSIYDYYIIKNVLADDREIIEVESLIKNMADDPVRRDCWDYCYNSSVGYNFGEYTVYTDVYDDDPDYHKLKEWFDKIDK